MGQKLLYDELCGREAYAKQGKVGVSELYSFGYVTDGCEAMWRAK